MIRGPGPRRVAIVGGGIAGLSCAKVLCDAGLSVTLFDKARKLGGRSSTRRVTLTEAGQTSFDHGAQYFTVRDPSFAALIERWRALGEVAPWRPRLRALVAGSDFRSVASEPILDDVERLVALPGMSRLPQLLLESIDPNRIDVHVDTRIVRVDREKFDWELQDAKGRRHDRFDQVILDLPAGQAAPLLAGHTPELEARALACPMDPCWTLMLRPRRDLDLDFDAAFVSNSPLAWVADNGSKPGRPPGQSWVLQAEGAWSQTHLEHDPGWIAQELLAAFSALIHRSIEIDLLDVHRWRYAKPTPLPEPFLHSTLGIGACGDWCGGPRIEGAFLSGQALAESILQTQD